MTLLTRKVYKPVNRCIYCGKDKARGKEHIIPFSLGGIWVLPRASCQECSAITGKFEESVARGLLGLQREQLGIQTRNPKRRTGKISSVEEAGGDPVYASVHDLPVALALPVLPPPAAASIPYPLKKTLSGELKTSIRQTAKPFPPEVAGKRFPVIAEFRPEPFMRMLAKIAHAFTAAEVGISNFKPLLTDIILNGDMDYVHHWMGGPDPRSGGGAYQGGHDHAVHYLVNGDAYVFGRHYIIASIQLFCNFGFEPYQVWVGEM